MPWQKNMVMFDTNMILRYLLDDNKEMADTVKDFLELVSCQEIDVLRIAIDTYKEHCLDFVDRVLYGYHKVKDIEIATFDKKLLQMIKKNGR